MKTRQLFLLFFLTGGLCFARALPASETALLDLITENLNSSRINIYLEPSSSSLNTDGNRRELKQIEAFGVKFSGRASFKETSVQAVSLWCDETRLAPDVASRLFSEMAGGLNRRLGDGKLISDVPNFEDASHHKKQVMLWPVDDQIVELSVDAYAARAGLSIQRIRRSLWVEQMGADQGEFWEKTLKAIGITTSVGPSNEQPSTQTPSTKSTSASMPSASTPELPEAKPAAANEKKLSSVWLLVGGLITLSVIGLFWLLLKKRN